MSAKPAAASPKDYKSDQEVRWCPGCGDYAILNQMQKVLAELGAERHKIVFVSGIGCSSRFPYYMNTYGFHSIPVSSPAIATGIKTTNPELDVWVITGDGDGLSIGAAHLVHAMRRNVAIKILLFNNRIYGLTKGQYSPTSELGKRTKSSPFGSIDHPVNPIAIALAAGATFVARCVDVDVKFQQQMLKRAAAHKGTAFVEIYQDCNVYNHLAWEYASDRQVREEHVVYLEHGKPLVFGKNRDRGIRLNGLRPEVVELGKGVALDDLLHHDEKAADPTLAFLLAQMRYPELPEPMGVFRDVEEPTYEELLLDQIAQVRDKLGEPDLEALFHDAETWTVE